MLNFPSSPAIGQDFAGGGSLWTWDGVKWEASSSAESLSVVTVSPVSGEIVIMAGRSPLYVNNAAVLAALTIRLPPLPSPSQLTEIGFRNSVTDLTVLTDAGTAIAGSPDSAYGPGAAIYMGYVDHIIGWVLWK